jgi:hypothetical protein
MNATAFEIQEKIDEEFAQTDRRPDYELINTLINQRNLELLFEIEVEECRQLLGIE